MAKRRRLSVPDPILRLNPDAPSDAPVRGALGTPPIASVAGDASSNAALAELSQVLSTARAEGRLIQHVALDLIDEDHLVRDRVLREDDALHSLKTSIAARGQQTPIELVELPGGRFGLIAGWRRLTALRQLQTETDTGGFDTALAVLRRPADAPDAYVAMVEENEIRVGLSFYERARIVKRAVEEGVYETQKAALQSLFATASAAKRSKVKSFIALVEHLDGALCHPTRIGERLGLALSARLNADPASGASLSAKLYQARPPSPEAEQSLLSEWLRRETAPVRRTPSKNAADQHLEPAPGLRLHARAGKITLSGPAIDETFSSDLAAWIATRAKG